MRSLVTPLGSVFKKLSPGQAGKSPERLTGQAPPLPSRDPEEKMMKVEAGGV